MTVVIAIADRANKRVPSAGPHQSATGQFVAKSGFNWNIRTRRALLDELLEYWTNELTEGIKKNAALLSMEPKKRLQAVAEAPQESDFKAH